MPTQINQRPPVFHGSLAQNFFAKVLVRHALVMYENHPKSLADGIGRQIALKQKEFELGNFYTYEDAPAIYKRELIEMTIMLCDADMAARGYPLVFTDFSFLQQTKRFGEYNWPLFYLLDAKESKTFAISGAYTPESKHIYPYSLPESLKANYYSTSREVCRRFSSDHVLITGNSKLAPDWARKHMQRADGTGLFGQLLIIGEAGDYRVITQRELQSKLSDFQPTDPIVVARRRFYKSFGPHLGDVTIDRYYVITAYDPTRAEFEILKGTKFY